MCLFYLSEYYLCFGKAHHCRILYTEHIRPRPFLCSHLNCASGLSLTTACLVLFARIILCTGLGPHTDSQVLAEPDA